MAVRTPAGDRGSRRAPCVALLAALTAGVLADVARAEQVVVRSGDLRAVVRDAPFAVTFTDGAGRAVLEGPSGGVGFRTGSRWAHATRATDLRARGSGARALVGTTARGRTIRVDVAPAGDGVIRMRTTVRERAGVHATAASFRVRPGERFVGFGERSHGVDLRGQEVENRVADGPFREADRGFARAVTPPWGVGERDDSTYFPIPWVLSSRGVGVLLDDDETSRFRLGSARPDRWSAEVDAPALRLRVFAGPRPADALRRFSAAVGRQPAPAAPWVFGPWFQTGQPNKVPLEEERRIIDVLRRADAPASAAETQMHYLPCGAHRGEEDYERRRNAQFHGAGLAHLAYLNPHLCRSYQPAFAEAERAGVLQTGRDGRAFSVSAFVGGSGPLGFTQEPIAQFDFTAPAAERFYARFVRALLAAGKDGWMEDFGEYTPPFAGSHDRTPGTRMHNRYPTTFHCAVHRIARRTGRPLTRHQRSGWTGSARCADIVWGGDPTTVWGFDGLASAVTQAISMGLSGVGRWGTDIGGYNTFGTRDRLTPELLRRWIAFGALTPVMRTKRSGIAVPPYERPQVFDPPILPVWRRYAKLHTQLHPYLMAADATYRRTGMPIVRHLLLAHPGDRRAVAADDEYLLGPDLLVAPVTQPGARRRTLYAPAGTWVDLWRSVRYDARGDGALLPRRTRLLRGGRAHTLPAPEDEIPLLVRAGAVLPLLSADVDTLAPFRARGVVTARDRADRLTLLAFSRGRWSGAFGAGERLRAREGRGRWSLAIDGKRRRTYTVRAALGALARPFRPVRVVAGGRRLPRSAWRYDAGTRVLVTRVVLRRGEVRVEGRRA